MLPTAPKLQHYSYRANAVRLGCNLKALFTKKKEEEYENWIPVIRKDVPAKTVSANNKRGRLTPLLIILFIASYCLMTLLIVKQGNTIQSQRNLIQTLQADSTQFWAIKSKSLHEKQMAQSKSQRQAPSTQTRLTGTPST
jgi:hypothetical protein